MTTIRPALDAAARATIAARTEALLRRTGALRDGVTELPDGRHATVAIDPAALFGDPLAVSELCGLWVAVLRGPDGHVPVDVVAGTGLEGGVVAFETGRQLGKPVVLLDERRAHAASVIAGARVLLVAASASTGAEVAAVVSEVEALGGEIVACDVFVDTSGEDRQTAASPATGRVYPYRALWRIDRYVGMPAVGGSRR